MSSTLSFDSQNLPDAAYEAPQSGWTKRRPPQDPTRVLQWAYVPMILCLSVNAVFLVAYWVPEFSRFPGHDWIFNQLAPLASMALTSQGNPVAPTQVGHGSLIATYLLLASLPLPILFRSRQWQFRLVMPAVLGWLGVVGLLVSTLSLLARGDLHSTFIGIALMVAWVAAIGVTTYRLTWANTDRLPARPRHLLWVVVLVAVLQPLAIAIGRWIFAPELRMAANVLLATDSSKLHYAALLTPASLAVYLSGVCVVALLWATYMMVPPWLPVRFPWTRRDHGLPGATTSRGESGISGQSQVGSRSSSFSTRTFADRPALTVVGDRLTGALRSRLVIFTVCLVALAVSGSVAAAGGAARAQQIALNSPSADLARNCASWSVQAADKPAQSLALSGAGCRAVGAYTGYSQTSSWELDGIASPVRATTPDDATIKGKVVAAQFGPIVVVATSDKGGFNAAPEQLWGLQVANGRQAWTYRCDDDGELKLRFIGASGGDDPAAGRVSQPGAPSAVQVACSNVTYNLDPQTGRPM